MNGEPDESDEASADGADWSWESTGHGRVDEVLAGLEELENDVHSHVAAFEGAHRSLRDILDGAGAEAAAEDASHDTAGED